MIKKSISTFALRLVRWVSGLNQQFAKLSYWKRYRGFESPLHRKADERSAFFIEHLRGVVQLVVCLVWDQEVVGSSPATPTEESHSWLSSYF